MDSYAHKVYSGVLGKLIGVYFGRPVEGWSYERIRREFDRITSYVNDKVGMPVHVPDDDLSGTFTFIRTLEDCPDLAELKESDFGKTWLDYVIENETIFWWGGFGRSTEHTAYLRLREGYQSPESGSIALNGQAVAEQIGAQIFMDGFALLCPDDPKMAKKLVRMAASVSHGGIAVESACFLAVVEALAFSIKNLDDLLDAAVDEGPWSGRLLQIINRVRTACKELNEWRSVRDWLEENYGYHLYPGNCHVVPNLALLLASLILGGDSFRDAMEIVVSSGWDTDCNGANVGCINGIRLGLDAITREYDYRTPVADRFYCVSSLGEECVTDAAIQTRKLLALHAKLYGITASGPRPRFGFEFPGSTQGFEACPVLKARQLPVRNGNTMGKGHGLYLSTDDGAPAAVSTLTLWDPADKYGGYMLVGSPTLYGGQKLRASFTRIAGNPAVRLYVAVYDLSDALHVTYSDTVRVMDGTEFAWLIPDTQGMPIARVGVELVNDGKKASVLFTSLDWQGTPERFTLDACLQNPVTMMPAMAWHAFTSSAKQFAFDKQHTLAVSHTGPDGVVDIGTSHWTDYSLTADIIPCLHEKCGLVARTHGHRRYYALLLEENSTLSLVRRYGDEEAVLAAVESAYPLDTVIRLSLSCCGSRLVAKVNDEKVMQVTDGAFTCGGAGFVVSRGTLLVDRMELVSLEK